MKCAGVRPDTNLDRMVAKIHLPVFFTIGELGAREKSFSPLCRTCPSLPAISWNRPREPNPGGANIDPYSAEALAQIDTSLPELLPASAKLERMPFLFVFLPSVDGSGNHNWD